MKKIKLIFNKKTLVYIYNLKNELVFEGQTCFNEIEICLKKHNVYRLVAISNYQKIITSFYVVNDKYKFYFNNPITFLLTDYYYNLPIERGELLLWQKQ